jgi:hypothetical protein
MKLCIVLLGFPATRKKTETPVAGNGKVSL